jgi:hypothetical protein
MKKYQLKFTGYGGMSGPIYKDTKRNIYFEDTNSMPPYDELAHIHILSPSNDPFDGEPNYLIKKEDYDFVTGEKMKDSKHGKDMSMKEPYEVAKYKGQWALYSKQSQTFDFFGTKKEMEEMAARLNAKHGNKDDVDYDFQKEGYMPKAKDGAINFRFSEKPLPTYVYDIGYPEDDDESWMENEAYEMAENLVDDAIGEIRNEAQSIINSIPDEVYNSEFNYLEDLFSIRIIPGENYGFSMVLQFDDFKIDGISAEERQQYVNQIKQVAMNQMKQIAAEVGMDKVISGGWTGPIKVEDAMNKDFFGAKQGSEEAYDILFALQALYGKPKYGYDDFRKMNLTQADVNKSIKFVKERELNKFTYFDEEKTQDGMKKSYDSADVGSTIEVNGILASALAQNCKFINNDTMEFIYEGKEIRITVTLDAEEVCDDFVQEWDFEESPKSEEFSSYEDYLDDVCMRVKSGDLQEDAVNALDGEKAFIEIWI